MATKDDYLDNTLTKGSIVLTAQGAGSATGTIDFANDHDWFKVTLIAGKHYLARPTFDLSMALFDASGKKTNYVELFSGWHNDPKGLTFTPKKTGVYYLDVFYKLADNPYTLTIQEQVDDIGDAAEFARKLLFTPQQPITVKGKIEYADDQDWFSVDLQAGKEYIFDGNNSYIDLYLIDSSKIIASSSSLNQNALSFIPTVSKAYYLKVSEGFEVDYSLTISHATDDYSANTQTTGLLDLANTLAGKIEKPGDHDWFKVYLQAGDTYTFDKSINSKASIYNATGLVKEKSLIDYPVDNFFTPDKSGYYYVDVYKTENSTGTYEISAKLMPDNFSAHLSTIKPIVVGDSAKIPWEKAGYDDRDWIPVQLMANKNYAIHGLYDSYEETTYSGIAGDFSETKLYRFETFVVLRDETGEPMPRFVSHGRDFTFSVPTSGKYYLDISSTDLVTDVDIPGSSALPFTPKPTFFEIKTYIDDYADNRTNSGNLTVVDNGAASISGSIETNGDHDWFKVSLTAGKNYVFAVQPNKSSLGNLEFPEIHIYTADSKPLSPDNFNQASFTAPTTGDYYLDLSSKFDNTSIREYYEKPTDYPQYRGNYKLTVTQTHDDYGNDRLHASAFYLGNIAGNPTTLKGNLEKVGDHDWFKVNLLAGKSYYFGVNSLPSLNGAKLAIYDAKGNLISKDYLTQEIGASVSGTYYLEVSAPNNKTGQYALHSVSFPDNNPGYFGHSLDINNTKYIVGGFGSSADHDVFAIKLTAGKGYLLQVLDMAYSRHDFTYDYDYKTAAMLLRDAKGNIVANSDKNLNFIASKSGIYYLDISPYGAKHIDPKDIRPMNEGYNILVTPYQYNNDILDNSATKANLALSQDTLHAFKSVWENIPSPYPGYIDSPYFVHLSEFSFKDTDWFKVALVKGQQYLFALVDKTNNPSFNSNTIHFSLVDAKAKPVMPLASSDLSLSFTVPKTGTYYLSASHDMTAGMGSLSYVLTGQQGGPIGNKQNNTLNGGKGADLLYGRGGNDVINGHDGNDILHGGSGNDTLNGGPGHDFLKGDLGNDILTAGDDNDFLNGGKGIDTLVGGLGNDTYYVDNPKDIVKETSTLPNEKDTVYSSVSYTLPANVENLVIIAAADGIKTIGTGNSLNNVMRGEGYTGLFGGAGNDRLIGSLLVGGLGKDTYELKSGGYITISRGDSLPASFDVVKGWEVENTFYNEYTLDLPSNHIAANIASVNGKDVGYIRSHHISNGLISFDNLQKYAAPLDIAKNQVGDVIKYMQANITKPGDTVAFVANHDTYVFQDGGAEDTLVQLVGVITSAINGLVPIPAGDTRINIF